jgi:hypothetical protein
MRSRDGSAESRTSAPKAAVRDTAAGQVPEAAVLRAGAVSGSATDVSR